MLTQEGVASMSFGYTNDITVIIIINTQKYGLTTRQIKVQI